MTNKNVAKMPKKNREKREGKIALKIKGGKCRKPGRRLCL